MDNKEIIYKKNILEKMCNRCRVENDGCPCEPADCFIYAEIVNSPSITMDRQKCIVCGAEMPGEHTETKICKFCRDAILWARFMKEAERIEKLNEKNRKEDEERWRKIMQGTL